MSFRFHKVLCSLALLAFLSLPVHAAEKSPDELFPQQSQQGIANYETMIRQQEQKRAATSEEWAAPAMKNKPATYGDLHILKKEIDELKAKVGP